MLSASLAHQAQRLFVQCVASFDYSCPRPRATKRLLGAARLIFCAARMALMVSTGVAPDARRLARTYSRIAPPANKLESNAVKVFMAYALLSICGNLPLEQIQKIIKTIGADPTMPIGCCVSVLQGFR